MKAESVTDILSWTPPVETPLIGSGLLLPKTKMIIYGRWETWKSMLTMHLALCMANGRDWLGFRTTPSSSLQLQMEIPKAQLKVRLDKYTTYNKCKTDSVWYINEPTLKLDRGYGITMLEPAIAIIRPRVLIIDPIYKVMSGDITKASDVQRLLDNIDALHEKFNMATILVSHVRKPSLEAGEHPIDMGHELMGSSYFSDWADTAIALDKTGVYSIKMQFVKVRHATEALRPKTISIDPARLKFTVIEGEKI